MPLTAHPWVLQNTDTPMAREHLDLIQAQKPAIVRIASTTVRCLDLLVWKSAITILPLLSFPVKVSYANLARFKHKDRSITDNAPKTPLISELLP
jgi:hypothetical protein